MKNTVIVGSSEDRGKYAYLAAERLTAKGLTFVPLGIREGEVLNQKILKIQDKPAIDDVGTITLYIGPKHQPQYYEYLLSLQPERIIFNPGTENKEFEQMAEEKGIETMEACTLTMLATNQF